MRNINLCLLSTVILFSGCSDASTAINKVKQGNSMQEDTQQDIVIGDLGGVPVEIPRNSVRLVEYNGDPGWGEVRAGAIPKRTYESKISSFGFDVRYTDGALYDGVVGEFTDEYEAKKNLSDSPWVSVGISSGDRYHGKDAVHRIGGDITITSSDAHPVFTYAKLPETQFGLEVYAPPGIDPETNTPWREDRHAKDIFIERDDSGIVITYIECSNRDVRHPPCTQYFDLEPEMGLYVRVSYSRYVLKDWQQIEQVVRKVVLDFRK